MDLPAFIGWLLATLLISIGVCREIHFRICRRRPSVVQAEQIHTPGMRGDSLGLLPLQGRQGSSSGEDRH